MTREELTAWALSQGWRMIAGHPSLAKPSLAKPTLGKTGAAAAPIVRLVFKASVVNLEVRKPAGKWEKVGGDSYARITPGEEGAPPAGLGFENVPSISMLMQANRDAQVFSDMGGASKTGVLSTKSVFGKMGG